MLSDNKRVARNSLMMYIRTLVKMIISLVTTRVIMQVLGVEGYGVYGIVSGIVVMLEFLNISMSGATSRFMNYEMGRENASRLRKTFSSAMITHLIVALIVLLLAETVGLWFMVTKLVIPPDKMAAAHWVYQFSIAATVVKIVQTPYTATVFAHEDMDVYAIIEIVMSVMLLAVALVLKYWNCAADKLILLGALNFAVMLVIMLSYRFYCLRKYRETKLYLHLNKRMIRPMLLFSALDLYGNGCVSVRQYGVNSLINIFFHVAYNATSSVATMVSGALQGLTYAVVQAFRPQIIKQYAQGNLERMQELLRNSCNYSLLLLASMAIPVIIEMPAILKLWLGNSVPPEAVIFCRLLVVASIWGVLNASVQSAIYATGRILLLSVVGGTLYLINLPIVWLLYHYHAPAYSAYTILIFTNLLILISNIEILKFLIPEFKVMRFVGSILLTMAVVAICSVVPYFLLKIMQPSLWRLFLVIVVNLASLLVMAFVFVADKKQKNKILQKIRNLL